MVGQTSSSGVLLWFGFWFFLSATLWGLCGGCCVGAFAARAVLGLVWFGLVWFGLVFAGIRDSLARFKRCP
ncbi:hypothetical protein, partial [Paraburkholderia caribensis]|uniref:hypothetical protein n=1 Tax=Paraburkholderia caribensis TaxID=75105 RepID=UPI003F494F5A